MKAYYVTETTNRQNLQDMIYIVYVVVLLLTSCSPSARASKKAGRKAWSLTVRHRMWMTGESILT